MESNRIGEGKPNRPLLRTEPAWTGNKQICEFFLCSFRNLYARSRLYALVFVTSSFEFGLRRRRGFKSYKKLFEKEVSAIFDAAAPQSMAGGHRIGRTPAAVPLFFSDGLVLVRGESMLCC
jgi:hypothetical protein